VEENMSEQANESLFRRLSDPFPYEAVSWAVIESAPGGQQVFVIPYVAAAHYKARLDIAAPGWKADYEVIDPNDPYIRCTLTIEGVAYTGIGDTMASDDTFAGKQDRSFIRACQTAGLGKYLQYISGVWVNYDKETRKIVPPYLPTWALPGGCGYPANVPGKRQFSQNTPAKSLRKPATSRQAQSATIQDSGKSGAANSAPVQAPKQSPQQPKPATQSNQPKAKPTQTPPAVKKQPDDAIANAQALKAWGDLVLKAHLAGIKEIESVRPPIQVGELRKRYAALKNQLDQIQNGGRHE